jgi:hypothetical protein
LSETECLNKINLNISVQNVNSLNVSKPGRIQMKKIVALLQGGADIIFLSDVRLNTNHNKSGIHNLEKQFFNKGYTLKYNSKKNSRGVGILFNKNLNYTEVGTMCDNGDNYFLYKIKIENINLRCGLWSK